MKYVFFKVYSLWLSITQSIFGRYSILILLWKAKMCCFYLSRHAIEGAILYLWHAKCNNISAIQEKLRPKNAVMFKWIASKGMLY